MKSICTALGELQNHWGLMASLGKPTTVCAGKTEKADWQNVTILWSCSRPSVSSRGIVGEGAYKNSMKVSKNRQALQFWDSAEVAVMMKKGGVSDQQEQAREDELPIHSSHTTTQVHRNYCDGYIWRHHKQWSCSSLDGILDPSTAGLRALWRILIKMVLISVTVPACHL